jgi:hypothetical protein
MKGYMWGKNQRVEKLKEGKLREDKRVCVECGKQLPINRFKHCSNECSRKKPLHIVCSKD